MTIQHRKNSSSFFNIVGTRNCYFCCALYVFDGRPARNRDVHGSRFKYWHEPGYIVMNSHMLYTWTYLIPIIGWFLRRRENKRIWLDGNKYKYKYKATHIFFLNSSNNDNIYYYSNSHVSQPKLNKFSQTSVYKNMSSHDRIIYNS